MHLLTFSLPVMWLIILVVLALAEAATINLVSIWFAAGALTALLVSLFCQNFWIQLVVFLLVSTLCLALVRPLAQKKFTPHLRPTNLDLLLGQYGVVTEDIDNLAATSLSLQKTQKVNWQISLSPPNNGVNFSVPFSTNG